MQDDPSESIFITAVFSLWALCTTLAIGIDYCHLDKQYRKTVVKVYGNSGHGSGSIVESGFHKSLVLTNRHVCEGIAYTQTEINKLQDFQAKAFGCMFTPDDPTCKNLDKKIEKFLKSIKPLGRTVSIKFNNLDKKDTFGTILKMSEKSDLCLVELNEGNLPTIRLSSDRAVAGDHIFALGNPLDMTNHLTDGYVGDDMKYEGRTYTQISAEFYPGSSGSPTVNESGHLVGVNTLGTQTPTQKYMIPLEDVKAFLEE